MSACISIHSVLTEADIASNEEWTVVSAHVDFVNALMRNRVDIGSMRPETVLSYYVDLYLAQVNNGGHEQFVRNTYVGRWIPWHKDTETLDAIANGLRDMGATEVSQIFNAFRERLLRDRPLLVGARNRGGFDDGYFGPVSKEIQEFDQAFFSANAKSSLSLMNKSYILSLPRVVVVPKEQRDEAILQCIDDHPQKEEIRADFAARGVRFRAAKQERIDLLIRLCAEAGAPRDEFSEAHPVDFKCKSGDDSNFYWLTALLGRSPGGDITAFVDDDQIVLADFSGGEEIFRRAATPHEAEFLGQFLPPIALI